MLCAAQPHRRGSFDIFFLTVLRMYSSEGNIYPVYRLRDCLGKVFERDNLISFPKTTQTLAQCSMILAGAFIFGDLRSGHILLYLFFFKKTLMELLVSVWAPSRSPFPAPLRDHLCRCSGASRADLLPWAALRTNGVTQRE